MSTCINDISDDGIAEILSETLPVARKQHWCGECHEAIPVGARYLREVAKFDGEIFTYKTCARCANIRRDFFNCWMWGGMVDAFQNQHGFDYRKGLPPGFAPCNGRATP